MMTYTLRPHQETCIERTADSIRSGNKRVIIAAAAGFGKTLVSISMIESALLKEKVRAKKFDEPARKIVFLVDRLVLIDQTEKEFDKYGLDFGIIQGSNPRYDLNKPLLLASVQSWVLLRKKPKAHLFFIDEAHCEYKKFVDFMVQMSKPPFVDTPDEPYFIGLTATPWKRGMANHWDDLVLTENTQQLIDMGFLSDYIAYGTDDIDLDNLKETAGDYNEKSLVERVNTKKIIGNIVETWLKRGENRQTILFCVNIAHSKAVCDEFEANGVPTGHIDHRTKPDERARLLKLHDDGEIKILSNCTVFSKGHDSPSTTCLILARPTKSRMLYIQMINRVLRVSPCGKDAIILDHSGTMAKLGNPEDIIITELDDGSRQSKKEKKIEELEREEKADKPCSDCGTMHNKVKCPGCGKEYRFNSRVEFIKAELKKLKRERKVVSPAADRQLKHSREKKQHMWSAFLAVAKNKGHASHLYRDYYGVWKTGLVDNKLLTDRESMTKAKAFKTAKAIAWANSKQTDKYEPIEEPMVNHPKMEPNPVLTQEVSVARSMDFRAK